jgi:hypothetical protein
VEHDYKIIVGMKKTSLILLMSLLFPSAYSQIIRGTILDKTDDSRITYASVYIEGTFVGTYTDQNGNFELNISTFNTMPLTISALGYKRLTLTDFLRSTPLIIYLTPKVFELNEVIINSRIISKERKENLFIFRNEFLGVTENGNSCIISNENDISFGYDSTGDTLKAFASKPLLINNKRLGYKLTYFLNRFEYCRKDKYFFYDGSAVFNKDSTAEGSEKHAFERRRRYTYIGSRMQFFRELWKDNIDNTGFNISNVFDEKLDYKDVVTTKDDQRKFFYYKNRLIISYYRRAASSYIKFLKKGVFFDQNGYFDPAGILWEGQMSVLRIGDLLPYEYISI